jgi:hypothetical protein
MNTTTGLNTTTGMSKVLVRLAALLMVVAASMPAAAQQSGYRYTLPAAWTSSVDSGVETLTPATEPAGTVQLLLLPAKPLAGDFNAQFDAERGTLEAHWGLGAPQAAPPQRGRTAVGPYAAHFASYASEGGPRYMSFLAIGRQGQFALLVFVAASDEAFNRLAPLATQLWQGLQVAP